MNEDFVKGWEAARAYWSANHGSLPPHPPQAPVEPPVAVPEPPKAPDRPIGGRGRKQVNKED